jgi:hypothetical protein
VVFDRRKSLTRWDVVIAKKLGSVESQVVEIPAYILRMDWTCRSLCLSALLTEQRGTRRDEQALRGLFYRLVICHYIGFTFDLCDF